MPRYGYRKVAKQLERDGYVINAKKVMRLMKLFGFTQKKRVFT
jgi:predicted RNA binding protein YcfA (HicA-like mRNA interferase family)